MGDSQEKIIFNFLSDAPETEDGFSGKGHERSASALANALVQLSDRTCSIGVEGTWGSGKTTVVALAQEQLKRESPKTFKFFTFDLWASQGVDFRRAFLEGFLRWAKADLGNKHGDLEKRVQGKTKTVWTEHFREFSPFGYILILALFFLPFLILWLSPFSANLHSISRNGEKINAELPWVFQMLYEYGHIGAATLIGAVIVGLMLQVAYLMMKKRSLREALDSSFSLLARKSDKDTVTQTIRDGDPTQYEFHEIFSEILSELQSSNRRVVLVFDNIDRLPEESIPEMWANVRSVFSSNSYGTINPHALVAAVVPYDREHVMSAFDNTESESPNTTSLAEAPPQRTYMLEDVVRKTFNAVITVSPPVMSHVNEFFNSCIERALPEQFDDVQRYSLFQIFDVFLTENSINPTPRQIKSFVNDVGMLWHQWRKELSIEAIGIFILHRLKVEADPRSLQNPKTIKPRYRHFGRTDTLDQELAALAFNVEPDIALEVLLGRDIISALQQENSARLKKLAASPGFQQQLDQILYIHCAKWAANSLREFRVALKNYVSLPIDDAVKEYGDKHFVQALPSLDRLNIEEWEQHRDLLLIVSCIPKKSLKYHLQVLMECVKSSLPDELTEQHGYKWVAFVGALRKEVTETHGEDAASSVIGAIDIPYSPEFYLGVALGCSESQIHFESLNSVAQSRSSDIASALITSGKENPINFSFQWQELQYALEYEDLDAVFKALIEQLQSNTLDEGDERQACVQNLVSVAASYRDSDEVIGAIRSSISDGSIPWHAKKFNDTEDWSGLGNIVWLASIALKTASAPRLNVQNNAPLGDRTAPHAWFHKSYGEGFSSETLEHIATLVIWESEVDAWLARFAGKPTHILHKNVLDQVLASEDCPPLRLRSLINHYEVLVEHFDAAVVQSIVEKVGQDTSVDAVDELDVSTVPPSLVQAIDTISGDSWDALLSRVDQHLRSLSKEEWEDALREDGNHNRELLFSRNGKLDGKIRPNDLSVPLADFIADVMLSEVDIEQGFEGYSVFWSGLPEASGKGLAGDVLDRVTDKNVSPAGLSMAISTFPDLFAQFPLKDKADKVVTKILLPLFSSSLEVALEYVEPNGSYWASCVAEADDDIQQQVNDHLVEIDDEEDETESFAARLRELLGRDT